MQRERPDSSGRRFLFFLLSSDYARGVKGANLAGTQFQLTSQAVAEPAQPPKLKSYCSRNQLLSSIPHHGAWPVGTKAAARRPEPATDLSMGKF